MEESITISIEQEEHQNRITKPRHRSRIQRDLDLWGFKNNYEEDLLDFDEYCHNLRKISYQYMHRFNKEN